MDTKYLWDAYTQEMTAAGKKQSAAFTPTTPTKRVMMRTASGPPDAEDLEQGETEELAPSRLLPGPKKRGPTTSAQGAAVLQV